MLEDSSPVPVKEMNTTRKNNKNQNQEKELESSSPVPENNLTFAQNQQESSANFLSNDNNEANLIPGQDLLIPAQIQQESSANSLSNKATSVNQLKSSPYVLSDDEIINQDSPNYSVAGSTNNDDVFTAPHSSITLQKKPEEILY